MEHRQQRQLPVEPDRRSRQATAPRWRPSRPPSIRTSTATAPSALRHQAVIQTDGTRRLIGGRQQLLPQPHRRRHRTGVALRRLGGDGRRIWHLDADRRGAGGGGGYDVAWHDPSSGLYTVWSTDSNGNYLSNLVGAVAGNSTALETFETTFNQDLNGDGTIGLRHLHRRSSSRPTATTALTEVGNNYFLNPTGGGTGPELHYGGSAVTAGEFGTWTPIGAVQVAVAATSRLARPEFRPLHGVEHRQQRQLPVEPGRCGRRQQHRAGTFETTFNQDLNGDGTIGLPPPSRHPDRRDDCADGGRHQLLPQPHRGRHRTGVALRRLGGDGRRIWHLDADRRCAGGGRRLRCRLARPEFGPLHGVEHRQQRQLPVEPGRCGRGQQHCAGELRDHFNQDLNGDGTIGIYVAPGTTLQVTSPLPSAVGAATIGAGATLELGTADSASITFSSSTGMLKLDSLTAFTGVIDNFTGNGSLSGSDQIDLKGINFNSVHDSYSNGILTVTDGTNTTTLDFNGTYVLANFDFASDGSGGTIVYDPPVPAQPQSPSAVGHTASSNAAGFFAGAGQDSFVFAPASGHNSATGWNPTMDAGQTAPRRPGMWPLSRQTATMGRMAMPLWPIPRTTRCRYSRLPRHNSTLISAVSTSFNDGAFRRGARIEIPPTSVCQIDAALFSCELPLASIFLAC